MYCLVNDIIDSPQEYLDKKQKIKILILTLLPITYMVLDKSFDFSLNLSFLLSFLGGREA